MAGDTPTNEGKGIAAAKGRGPRTLKIFEPETVSELFLGWQLHVFRRREIHEKAARRAQSWSYGVGVPTAILAGLAGSAAVGAWQSEAQTKCLLLSEELWDRRCVEERASGATGQGRYRSGLETALSHPRAPCLFPLRTTGSHRLNDWSVWSRHASTIKRRPPEWRAGSDRIPACHGSKTTGRFYSRLPIGSDLR